MQDVENTKRNITMADEQEQILNIRVNYTDAVRGIQEYQAKVAELQGRILELDKAFDDGSISAKEHSAAIIGLKNQVNVYNGEIRTLNKEIQNNIKIEEAQEGSLKQLRAQLSNLTKEYDSLSKSERESGERGKQLREAINSTTTQIKSAEEATQRYYRNVGNYENAIKNTLGTQSKWFQQLEMIRDAMSGGVANGIKMAGQAVASFGKQLLALLANPIVAVIAAIAAAFMALKEGISSSEENTRTLQRVLAPFKRVLEGVLNVLQQVAGWILNAVEGAEKLALGFARLAERLPLVGDRIKKVNDALVENIELERQRQEIEDAQRRNEVLNAKTARDVAKLRAQAAETNDPAKRAKMLKEAIDLEGEELKRNYDLAKSEYDVAKAQAAHADNTKEVNDALAQAEAKLYQAEEQYWSGTMRLRSQLNTAEKQSTKTVKSETSARSQAREEAAQRAADAAKKEQDAIRQAEDALLALIHDRYEKEIETQRIAFDRQIEDLQKRLATEKNLTETARNEINTTIIALTQQRNYTLSQMEEEHARENIEKAVKAEEERLNLIIETTRKGSEAQRAAQEELLRQQQDAAIMEVEQSELTETQKNERLLLIAQLYEQKRAEIRKAAQQEEIAAIQADFEQRIQQEAANALVQQQLRVEQKKAELDALHQVEGESEKDFLARQLEAKKAYTDAANKLTEEENKVTQSRLTVASNTLSGLSAIMDAFGEENKAAAAASKILALAQVAIDTGKAISAGVASAMSTPFPANIAAVATTIATVMANITTAIKTIKSAKFAEGGTISTDGGNVSGTGTGTSDSITAQLSNGESVMTAATTAMFAPLLSTLNQAGGGVPIQPTNTIYTQPSAEGGGMDLFTDTIVDAVKAIPRPVVSVEEISNVATRVEVLENLATAKVQ